VPFYITAARGKFKLILILDLGNKTISPQNPLKAFLAQKPPIILALARMKKAIAKFNQAL